MRGKAIHGQVESKSGLGKLNARVILGLTAARKRTLFPDWSVGLPLLVECTLQIAQKLDPIVNCVLEIFQNLQLADKTPSMSLLLVLDDEFDELKLLLRQQEQPLQDLLNRWGPLIRQARMSSSVLQATDSNKV